MVEFILGAFLYAKFKKKYELKYIFKHWSIAPPLLFAIFYIFLEYTMFIQWYYFIPYAQAIKTATLLSYIPLIITYKLWNSDNPKYINNDFLDVVTSPMVKAGLCLWLGSTCNRIALHFNDGLMPTYPSLAFWTGYIDDSGFIDGLHILGNAHSAAIPLCNIFDIGGFTVVSIGDILIRFFAFIILYGSIKRSNKLIK